MKLDILFLCNKPRAKCDASTIVDHIDAFDQHSQNTIWVCSNLGNLPRTLDLKRFDVIVIHYSLCLFVDTYLSQLAKKKISQYPGLKVVFIQDEYRRINHIIDELAFLNVDVLFTCFPETEMGRIYTDKKLPNLSKYTNLTGYIPKYLLQKENHITPISQRHVHIGYRGRRVPYCLGELSYEKYNIVEKWHKFTQDANLTTDISCREEDRIYGPQWNEFLSSCKATLGVESGASVMDFTGELETLVNLHQQNYPDDSFSTVQALYLKEHEGLYKLNQISPRCFEAIVLKTVLVLYEGEYSGILVPDRHYIMLKKDFSNIESVVARLADDEYLQQMADITYVEIGLNPEYSYEGYIEKFDRILMSEYKARAKPQREAVYNQASFRRALFLKALQDKAYQQAVRCYRGLRRYSENIKKSLVSSTTIH